tara:strand:- start:516 stop:782 length:267 start_codon:yes stop_codon:yes gene_type:complete
VRGALDPIAVRRIEVARRTRVPCASSRVAHAGLAVRTVFTPAMPVAGWLASSPETAEALVAGLRRGMPTPQRWRSKVGESNGGVANGA